MKWERREHETKYVDEDNIEEEGECNGDHADSLNLGVMLAYVSGRSGHHNLFEWANEVVSVDSALSGRLCMYTIRSTILQRRPNSNSDTIQQTITNTIMWNYYMYLEICMYIYQRLSQVQITPRKSKRKSHYMVEDNKISASACQVDQTSSSILDCYSQSEFNFQYVLCA